MATFIGKHGVVKIDKTTIAEIKSFSITQQASSVDATAMGDEWAVHKTTQKSWSGSLSCHFDSSDMNGQEALTIGALVTLKLLPQGSNTGDYELTGNALITDIQIQTEHSNIIERSFTFQGTGPLTIDKVI